MAGVSAPKEVIQLVERFDRNRDSYLAGGINETQLRQEFINPFFSCLGWDIENKQGYAPAYREVIFEDSLRVGAETKAPDYCFRIGGMRKFFVEAKKPAVNIATGVAPAFQLKRYAWTAKLPLSILTDFEEFAVYDCRARPFKTDKPSIGRIKFLEFKDYPVRWAELYETFSRDAVVKGSFDKFVEENRARKGTTEVDDAFLSDIERWRDLLARNIALRNPRLTTRELNFAVQRTIDRIIFLRICEDRLIEPYGQLQALLNGERVYPRLKEAFQRADDKYNSGLFHFREAHHQGHQDHERNSEQRTGVHHQGHQDHQANPVTSEPADLLSLRLVIDDKVLKDIIANLYYPDSPYEFSVFPSEILGQVYEQFLGKVIRLTAGHQAKVEDKPEVRKAGGVYYTPTYIVDYIVKNTVGKLLDGRAPSKESPVRVLDPACGSGSFLLGAFQYLLNWHRDWYVKDGPEKHTKELFPAQGGDWRLTTAKKKEILLNSIYGVDIDQQAVEVTKLSLLLKVLEGENEQTIGTNLKLWHDRALPDLGNNIKCGNSLIGPDFYQGQQASLFDDVEERLRVNTFDWDGKDGFPDIMKAGGFDAVIGNPPYDVLEKDRGEASWPHAALVDYVRIRQEYAGALGGKLNLFRFFLIRSMMLTRPSGRFGMIVPMALLADISCAATRRSLLLGGTDFSVDCFPQKDNPSRRVFADAKLSTTIITYCRAKRVNPTNAGLHLRVYPWNSFADRPRESHVKLEDAAMLDPDNLPIPLVSESQLALCRKLHSRRNVRRLADVPDYTVTRGEINQTIYRDFITTDTRKSRLVKGAEIGQYRVRTKMSQGQHEWLDEKRFLAENESKPIAKERRIATQRITGVDERLRIVATVIEPPAYFADSTNSVTSKRDAVYRLEYFLGLLNSTLFQWRFKLTSSNNNVGTNELNSLPFRTIDFTDKADKARHDKMVSLVERMLKLHMDLPKARTAPDKTAIERQIAATDGQIDRLVYELYGLTEAEVRIVEDG